MTLLTPTRYRDFDPSYVANLATTNGFSYTPETTISPNDNGLYTNPHSSSRLFHKLDFVIDGLACEYYTDLFLAVTAYKYAKQIAASAADIPVTQMQVQVFAVTLPFAVEDLYVESRTNISLNNIVGLRSVSFDGDDIQLEGDFNEFFNVYTPLNEELTAFTILAPNIMVRMLQEAGNYDFEFAGNKVYFYYKPAYADGTAFQLNQQTYDALLRFGIESARRMARAARPAQRPVEMENIAMWQLFATNPKILLRQGLGIGAFVGLLFLCFAVPFLWLALPLFPLWFAYKFWRLLKRRARLVANWGIDSQPQIVKA